MGFQIVYSLAFPKLQLLNPWEEKEQILMWYDLFFLNPFWVFITTSSYSKSLQLSLFHNRIKIHTYLGLGIIKNENLPVPLPPTQLCYIIA